MSAHFSKFPTPVLSESAQNQYTQLYGDEGSAFVEILNTCPEEIAVISRMVMYYHQVSGKFIEPTAPSEEEVQ